MTEPHTLFLCETTTPEGQMAKLAAMQRGGRVVLGIEIGDDATILRLNAAQAVGLATQLLAANLVQLVELAGKLDPSVRQHIAAALLTPDAAAALLDQATQGQTPA
jgi:hypothetical protein